MKPKLKLVRYRGKKLKLVKKVKKNDSKNS